VWGKKKKQRVGALEGRGSSREEEENGMECGIGSETKENKIHEWEAGGRSRVRGSAKGQ